MKFLTNYLQRIIDLCRLHKVKSLAVFGSVLTDRFHDDSDIDLLIDFEPFDPNTFDYATNYFDLQDALESLLQRKVDLVVGKSLTNPIFIKNVSSTKLPIYG
ncbi:MAG: nucleotidyltransferase domain-containing protein [Bacteroidales bacterium]|nr:nucleotidyltransferase domain-containing protein [Bacteroidales bacterium]MCD8393411.1 nucleotidyltransferase domain-containing protein [Bacteroidales bacterium]